MMLYDKYVYFWLLHPLFQEFFVSLMYVLLRCLPDAFLLLLLLPPTLPLLLVAVCMSLALSCVSSLLFWTLYVRWHFGHFRSGLTCMRFLGPLTVASRESDISLLCIFLGIALRLYNIK